MLKEHSHAEIYCYKTNIYDTISGNKKCPFFARDMVPFLVYSAMYEYGG
jgi:hypothetical protein